MSQLLKRRGSYIRDLKVTFSWHLNPNSNGAMQSAPCMIAICLHDSETATKLLLLTVRTRVLQVTADGRTN
jgi:hypothetical protein